VRQVMVWGTAITALSYFMLNVDFGIIWLYMAMFILSTGEMLTLPFMATISIKRAGLHNQGAYMGFNSLAFAAANIFSPYCGTYLAEHFGYNVLWTVAGTTLLTASLGFYWIISRMKV
jgi:predicted MFS family arabinose efflux permease